MRQIGETRWMDVILDTDSMEITVVQRWKYHFESVTGYDWTEKFKGVIKTGVKDLIYTCWNQKAYAIVNTNKGNSFNQLYGKKTFTINFKIESVTCGEHWNVIIVKNHPDSQVNSTGVEWEARRIYLNDFDFCPSRGYAAYVKNQQVYTKTRDQCAVAHEFGHAIGNNGTEYYTGDEYVDVSKEHAIINSDGFAHYPIEHVKYPNRELYGDIDSMMNVGNEVRHRHFAFIRDMLQEMLPGSYFSIRLF